MYLISPIIPWWDGTADDIETIATPTVRTEWIVIVWVTFATVRPFNL